MANGKHTALPTGSYWDAHYWVGEFALSPESRVLVSTVLKDRECYVRLRTYRLAARGGKKQWVHTNQLMLFPASVVPELLTLLQRASEQLPVPARGAAPRAETRDGETRTSEGLSAEEMAKEGAVRLPDREALSVLGMEFDLVGGGLSESVIEADMADVESGNGWSG